MPEIPLSNMTMLLWLEIRIDRRNFSSLRVENLVPNPTEDVGNWCEILLFGSDPIRFLIEIFLKK